MKKERLEQALDGIDPVFVEEAAAFAPAKAGRRAWKRMVLVAACLAAALAVSAAAVAVTGGWELYFAPNEEGVELPSAKIHHGGAQLPAETKQRIREAAAAAPSEGDQPYGLVFTFDTLAEMEVFVGCDLLESTLYPVNAQEEIQCKVNYSTGKRMTEEGWQPWEEFSIRGEYAFDKGEWNNWVRFYINTYDDAALSVTHQGEDEHQAASYPLEQLDTTASVLTTPNKTPRLVFVYLSTGHVAYEMRCAHSPDLPTDFLDSLY